MAEQSIYSEILRMRFPNAKPVFGSGAYAVLSRCPQVPFVTLYETALEAKQAAVGVCTHAFCKGQHQFVSLAELPPVAPVRFVKKAHWAALIDEED